MDLVMTMDPYGFKMVLAGLESIARDGLDKLRISGVRKIRVE